MAGFSRSAEEAAVPIRVQLVLHLGEDKEKKLFIN